MDPKTFLLLLVCAVTGSCGITTLEIGTRYVTRSVATVLAEQRKVFAASTCGQFVGNSANITILLNNNPEWNPVKGVVYFYVVDDPKKSEDYAICHNHPAGKPAVPFCSVQHWNSSKDLFIVTTAGRVSAVSFTVNVQFRPKPVMEKYYYIEPQMMAKRNPYVVFPRMNDDIYYLSEIAETSTTQQLLYQEQVILDVSFCANKETTDDYLIRSIVFGTDDISSFTQHICDQADCTIEGTHVIAYNGNQLPSNTVDVTTQHAQYQRLFVLLTCWGGDYNPAKKAYECNYQYTGSIRPK
ncbi:uncharacterized protein [Ptychodera flava]|uniref:uncharacterized protein n=1 Tax=Ptychodera flava TaxID=63121 RepID=UPI00396A2CD6